MQGREAEMERTAIITGASRGLGLALARALARRGWALVIDARGGEALERARAELSEHAPVTALSGNVADEGHLQALLRSAEAYGRLDALINNASVLGPSPQPELAEYPVDVLGSVL